MKLQKVAGISLVALSLVLGSTAAMAGGHGAPKQGKASSGIMQKALKGLDLTAEQQTQIKAILQKMRQENKAFRQANRAQAQESHKAMQNIVLNDSFDEAAYKSLIQASNDKKMTHRVAVAKSQNEIYKLLTPAQQSELKSNLAEMMSRKGEKRQ